MGGRWSEERDRGGIASGAERKSKKWGRELQRNIAEECEVAAW